MEHNRLTRTCHVEWTHERHAARRALLLTLGIIQAGYASRLAAVPRLVPIVDTAKQSVWSVFEVFSGKTSAYTKLRALLLRPPRLTTCIAGKELLRAHG